MRYVLACLLSLAALVAQAEVYHWTDDTGAINITSKPPAQRAVDATATGKRTYVPQPAPPPDVAPAAKPGATPVAAKAEVTMYMASWCGYCKKAKAHLKERGIAYREVDIESTINASREFRNLGGRTVPLIYVGGERIVGYTRESLDAMLRRGGYF